MRNELLERAAAVMLQHVGTVLCPKCNEPVKIWAEPGEKLIRAGAPRCPECKTQLYDQARELLGPAAASPPAPAGS